jgi:hypothetical protein
MDDTNPHLWGTCGCECHALPHPPVTGEGPCGGDEPTADLALLTVEQLVAAYERLEAQDPNWLDWPTGHPGRRIREEIAHRTTRHRDR